MRYDFDAEKNEKLFRERGVTFSSVIETIAEKGVLADFEHPNKEKYPHQRILIVEINGYAYCVPYVMDGETLFLKTIYPNRRFKFLLEGEENG